MKKDLILIIFPTLMRSQWFFEDNIAPLMPELKKLDNITYENDKFKLKLCSSYNSDNLRGYNASFIFLSDECNLKTYNDIVLHLVKGDHSKVKVVI